MSSMYRTMETSSMDETEGPGEAGLKDGDVERSFHTPRAKMKTNTSFLLDVLWQETAQGDERSRKR